MMKISFHERKKKKFPIKDFPPSHSIKIPHEKNFLARQVSEKRGKQQEKKY
jgi:hypothetical protein